MATVIAFEQLVAARRRMRARDVHAQCVALLEASCNFIRGEVVRRDPAEQELWLERLRRVESLLQYARQWS